MIVVSIYIIFLIAIIILHYAIYNWTNDLKLLGCKCSDTTIRDILNNMALIFLLIIPYRIVHDSDKYFSIFFYRFINMLSLIYYILIIYYIDKLNRDACRCSENWKKDYSFITTIIFLCLILFIFLCKLILLHYLK
jgi:hypothetical protein